MTKRLMQLASLLLISVATYAQTEVTAGSMHGKEYGVTYILPKTEIVLTIQATKHTYTPGEFCKYADQYLRLNDLSAEPMEYWTLNAVQTDIKGLPNKDNVYFVKLKDKSVAPLMELTEDGIIRSINMPFSGNKKPIQAAAVENAQQLDPKNFLTEEILMANSTAKMAELVAKEIYSIRESKNSLLRGEADNMPKDGAQLKLMLDNLNRQEQAMIDMFAGKTIVQPQTFTVRMTPKEMKNEVAFRFSKKLGLVAQNDLAGEPAYISLTDLKVINIPAESNEKKVTGIAYNIPGKARLSVSYDNRKIFEGDVAITQFGTVEYLAPVLFNKNSTTKVLFDTNTGGIIKVDRGE